MKNFLLLLTLSAGFALAESEICAQLCTPCKQAPAGDATCESVFSVCGCEELLSKLEAEAEAQNAAAEAQKVEEVAAQETDLQDLDSKRRALLGNSLFEQAEAGKFQARFWFSNDSLREFAAETVAGLSRVQEPKLPPLGSECVELCGVIAAVDDSNPMVAQIETSCGCTKHVEDSLAVIDFKNARVENASFAADSVVSFCSGAKVCRVQLLMKPEDYSVQSLERLPNPKPDSTALARKAIREDRLDSLEDVLYDNCFDGNCNIQVKFFEELISLRAATPIHEKISEPNVHELAGKCVELCTQVPEDPGNVIAVQMEKSCGCKKHLEDSLALEAFRAARDSNVSLAADSVASACFAIKNCEVKVALDEATFKLLSLEVLNSVPKLDTAAVQAPKKSVPEASDVVFKTGVSLSVSTFTANYEVDAFDMEWSEAGAVEVGIGFVARWYFAKWFSLQSGLNFVYNSADLGSETYGAGEIPEGYLGASSDYYLFKYALDYQSFAAELPLELRFYYRSFYGVFLFGARKGLWERLEYDSESALAKNGTESSGKGFDDWEFLGNVGVGYEFRRQLSAEILFGVFDVGTVDAHVRQSFAWRIKLDYIW